MPSTIHHDYVTGRRDKLYYLHSLLVMFVSSQLNFKLSTEMSTIDIETIITIAIPAKTFLVLMYVCLRTHSAVRLSERRHVRGKIKHHWMETKNIQIVVVQFRLLKRKHGVAKNGLF